jgi:hypothetical protein
MWAHVFEFVLTYLGIVLKVHANELDCKHYLQISPDKRRKQYSQVEELGFASPRETRAEQNKEGRLRRKY